MKPVMGFSMASATQQTALFELLLNLFPSRGHSGPDVEVFPVQVMKVKCRRCPFVPTDHTASTQVRDGSFFEPSSSCRCLEPIQQVTLCPHSITRITNSVTTS